MFWSALLKISQMTFLQEILLCCFQTSFWTHGTSTHSMVQLSKKTMTLCWKIILLWALLRRPPFIFLKVGLIFISPLKNISVCLSASFSIVNLTASDRTARPIDSRVTGNTTNGTKSPKHWARTLSENLKSSISGDYYEDIWAEQLCLL